MDMGAIPYKVLNNGVNMPLLGFGLYQLKDHEKCRDCAGRAIRSGYRLFDTASAYFNEDALGEACRSEIESGTVKREELFITTKVWLQDYGTEETRRSVFGSMKKLQTDYLDLVLLHQPFGNWHEAWRALEDMNREGIIRAIGTSNFTREKMDELLGFAETVPQIDQIEIHPFYTQNDYTAYLESENIQPEAWGPLCEGLRGIFSNPVLERIGQEHGKSAAQTALRWSLQKGNIIIPKGTQPEHMQENLEIFDFSLSDDEMREISAMDLGHSEIIDFRCPATERLLMKWKIHD